MMDYGRFLNPKNYLKRFVIWSVTRKQARLTTAKQGAMIYSIPSALVVMLLLHAARHGGTTGLTLKRVAHLLKGHLTTRWGTVRNRKSTQLRGGRMSGQVLNFNDALSQKRLAQEQEIAEVERDIVELEMRASQLRLKRNRLEREYLGERGHTQKQIMRRADKLNW